MAPSLPALIQAAARKTGVSADVLTALIRQESGGNPAARSPVGATGYTQLMPGTARGLGVNPNDPAQNVLGGARYLKQQLDQFHSLPLALSAYNSGPGGSEASGRVEAFPETQRYVQSIMGSLGQRGSQSGGGASPANLASLLNSAPLPASPSASAGSSGLDSLLGDSVDSLFKTVGLGGASQLGSLLTASPSRATASRRPVSLSSAPAAPSSLAGHGGIAELLNEGVGGPTHSTGAHVHAAFNDPQLALAAIAYAQQHGLHVGENAYVGDTVDPVHAKNSYHYQTFPGRFNGRKLGRAIDVSGGDTSGFYKFLAGRR